MGGKINGNVAMFLVLFGCFFFLFSSSAHRARRCRDQAGSARQSSSVPLILHLQAGVVSSGKFAVNDVTQTRPWMVSNSGNGISAIVPDLVCVNNHSSQILWAWRLFFFSPRNVPFFSCSHFLNYL